jgi:hypothetical protein
MLLGVVIGDISEIHPAAPFFVRAAPATTGAGHWDKHAHCTHRKLCGCSS